MAYFSKNKEKETVHMESFIEEIRDNAEKKGLYWNAIQALLLFIKDFSMDFEETGSRSSMSRENARGTSG